MIYSLSLDDILFLLFWALFLDGYSLLAIIIGIFLLKQQELKMKKTKKQKQKKLYNKMKL